MATFDEDKHMEVTVPSIAAPAGTDAAQATAINLAMDAVMARYKSTALTKVATAPATAASNRTGLIALVDALQSHNIVSTTAGAVQHKHAVDTAKHMNTAYVLIADPGEPASSLLNGAVVTAVLAALRAKNIVAVD